MHVVTLRQRLSVRDLNYDVFPFNDVPAEQEQPDDHAADELLTGKNEGLV